MRSKFFRRRAIITAFIVFIGGICPSVILYAKPITLQNLNLKMSIVEIQEYLIVEGYKCSQKTEITFSKKYVICEKENKKVVPIEDRILFGCANFNICDYGIREVAKILIEKGIVNSMEYKDDPNLGNFGFGALADRYCGRGDEGDEICVFESYGSVIGAGVAITIDKGSLGSSGVNFN